MIDSSHARTAVLLLVMAGPAVARQSPYAGLEAREIKALPPEAIAGYLEGRGMGFAMAAELNSWPGPKHVLEAADKLGLDPAQTERTESVFRRMHDEAVRLGSELVDGERRLDELFASRKIDEERLKTIVAEIGRTRAELRFTHLRAHLEMGEILSEAQIRAYDEIRGYGSGRKRHHGPHR